MTQQPASPGRNYVALAPLISPHEQINLHCSTPYRSLPTPARWTQPVALLGKACVILRRAAPKDERRLNALLHCLVRKL